MVAEAFPGDVWSVVTVGLPEVPRYQLSRGDSNYSHGSNPTLVTIVHEET